MQRPDRLGLLGLVFHQSTLLHYYDYEMIYMINILSYFIVVCSWLSMRALVRI